MKKIVFSLLMLVPFGLVSCFSGASKSSTEEIENTENATTSRFTL
ncbi:MAG: hypothetical protein ACLUVG_12095 [Phocaeicola vulgatus]